MKNQCSFKGVKKRPSGFALIISLALMSLLLVFSLALTSTLKIQIEQSSMWISQELAQENALMAMRLALGQLQKQAGPDQRITARADISESSDENRYWTGVWDSDPQSNEYGEHLTWLVNPENIKKSAHGSDSVLLVGENSARDLGKSKQSDEVSVKVNPQTILDEKNQPIGSFAYWVGDEGIKHTANYVSNDYLNESYLHVIQNSAKTGLAGMESFDELDFDHNTYQQLSRALTHSQLEIIENSDLSSDDKVSRQHFHNISTYSKGLFTNVRDGGLKKDLTIALQPNAAGSMSYVGAEPESSTQQKQMWGTGGVIAGPNTSSPDPGGPPWAQLRSFYNLPDAIEFEKNTSISNAFQSNYTDKIAPRPHKDDQMGIFPVISQFNYWYYGSVVRQSGAKWIRTHFFPAVTLWNPYDITIKAHNYYFRFSGTRDGQYTTGNTSDYDFIPSSKLGPYYEIKVKIAPSTSTEWSNSTLGMPYGFPGTGTTTGSNPEVTEYEFVIQCPDIPPGEAIVFSPSSNFQYNLTDYTLNPLDPGFRGAKYCYLDGDLRVTTSDHISKIKIFENKSTNRQLTLALANDKTKPDEFQEANQFPLQVITGIHGNLTSAGYSYDAPSTYVATTAPDIVSGSADHPDAPRMGFKGVLQRMHNDPVKWGMNGRPKVYSMFNPRARIGSKTPFDFTYNSSPKGYQLNQSFYTALSTNNAVYKVESFDYNFDGIENAYVGYSNTGSGNFRQILFHVPRNQNEFTNIGSLVHAHLTKPGYDPTAGFESVDNMIEYWSFDCYQPAYPIGNSRAHVLLKKNQVFRNHWENFTTTPLPTAQRKTREPDCSHYDWSYLLNDVLWDSYFFSNIPQEDSEQELLDKYTQVKKDSDGDTLFPDPRKTLRNQNMLDWDALYRWDESAGQLLLNGAFNINSTSKEAWKGLLSSSIDNKIQYIDEMGILQKESNKQKVPFLRVPYLFGEQISGSMDNTDDAVHQGYKSLTLKEVDLLAEEIVKQVKERGPFFSLAHFINRSLEASSKTEHQLSGALQQAIDESEINAGLSLVTTESEWADPHYDNYDREILAGEYSDGLTTYLTQADLLQQVGNVLQARSDTFRIRAYGSYDNASTGKKEAQAWCEAIVQRIPDFVDQDLQPEDDLDQDVFGRKFQIIEFRWLTRNDI